MKFDGRVYRRNRYLGWRNARDGDQYAGGGITKSEGEQIGAGYVVVFRIKDAPTVMGERGGQPMEFYKPNDVASDKLLPLAAHSTSCLAYGTPKLKTGVPLRDVRYNCGEMAGHIVMTGQKYIEQPHYLVRDGMVYQWTSRRAADADEVKAA